MVREAVKYRTKSPGKYLLHVDTLVLDFLVWEYVRLVMLLFTSSKGQQYG
jgi:hypothetical protein